MDVTGAVDAADDAAALDGGLGKSVGEAGDAGEDGLDILAGDVTGLVFALNNKDGGAFDAFIAFEKEECSNWELGGVWNSAHDEVLAETSIWDLCWKGHGNGDFTELFSRDGGELAVVGDLDPFGESVSKEDFFADVSEAATTVSIAANTFVHDCLEFGDADGDG